MYLKIPILSLRHFNKGTTAVDTAISFKNKPRTFDKQHCQNGKNLAHIRYQFGANINCDIENIELSPRKIVRLQSVYCGLEV